MLITKETDYALRILRALAKRGRLTATELSEREQIPLQFAYKVLKKLQKGGFLQILRGPGGGYRLSTPLDQVTLYQLIQMAEAPLYVSPCIRPGYQCPWCEAHDEVVCHVHLHLQTFQKKLEEELQAITLQQMLFEAPTL
jgi:Rrf2 family protein